jgi:hypothetical protein
MGEPPSMQTVQAQCLRAISELEVQMAVSFTQDPTQIDPERWITRPTRFERWTVRIRREKG